MLAFKPAFFMLYYFYILQSQVNNSFYKGSTDDLSRRLVEHNEGKSTYTSKYLPWDLVWYGIKPNRSEAIALEQKLKNLSVKKTIEFIARYPSPGDFIKVTVVRI